MWKKILFIALLAASAGIGAYQVQAEGKYSIKQMTPEVEAALNSRRERFDQLRRLKSDGIVGENNKGYIDVLQDTGDAQAVSASENKDRHVIYQTIGEQNGLENALGAIESVFAQVQRDKAGPGDKIQSEDGRWDTK